MHENNEVKARILEIVSSAENRKVRPRVLEQSAMTESGFSVQSVRRALSELMREEKLVYTYRDPCSFVEIPEKATT